jgi:hypothetical protein
MQKMQARSLADLVNMAGRLRLASAESDISASTVA